MANVVFLCALILILLAIFRPRKNNSYLSLSNLYTYLGLALKNRKNGDKRVKNGSKMAKWSKKHEIGYSFLHRTRASRSIKNALKNSEPKTYVEQHNAYYSRSMLSIYKEASEKINKNQNRYRSYNHECLIETISKSYAQAVLTEERFNMFEDFRRLSLIFKVYKREAEVLNLLVVSELCKLYFKLMQEVAEVKRQVRLGAKASRLKSEGAAFIYGAYMFNPKSTKLFLDKKKLVISSTNLVLEQLDEILKKQRILFKYANFLYEGVK